MELLIKFRDNPKDIIFNIDRNSVLYGFNGTGKTRILKSLKEISDVERNKNRILDILETYNIEQLMIEGTSLQMLFDDKDAFEAINSEFYEDFITINFTALLDFKMVIKDIIETNRTVPFFPIARFRNTARRVDRLLDKNGNEDRSRGLQILLRQSMSMINEVQSTIRNSDFNSLERSSQIEYASDIISFLQRRYEDYKYDNEKRTRRIKVFNEAYKRTQLSNLSRTAKYISTSLDELIQITNKIEKDYLNLKTKLSSEYIAKLINSMKDNDNSPIKINDMSLRVMMDKISRVNKIISKYMNVVLSFDGNNLLAKKDEAKLELTKLSSGEQRLLTLILNSIFSSEKLLLLDEPEISLSLNYQSRIMNDLLETLGDKKVILATHAPFIYKACKSLDFDLVEL